MHTELVTGPFVTQSGTLTTSSPTVTGLTTSALSGAVSVTGTGIPPGTFVLSVDGPGQVTLTQAATATGSQSLTFALEPITLAEAKAHCRVQIPDDDDLIATLITAARLRCEALLRSTLLLSTFDFFMDQFPYAGGGYYNRIVRQMGPGPNWLPTSSDTIIRLPNPPIVSIASVKFYAPDGTLTTIDPATYFVSLGSGSRIQPVPGNVWPVARQQIDAVVIRYAAGVATAASVTANVKAAAKLMVGHWYEHREEVGDAETYPVPNAVDALLAATDPGIYS